MELKLLSLNAWFVPFYSQHSLRRAEALSQYLKEEEFDVVLLQEVFLSQARKRITSYLKSYNSFYSRHRIGSGLLVLSKFPFTFKKFVPYKKLFNINYPLSALDWLGGKGFQCVKISIKEKRDIFFINTHLQTPYDCGQGIKNEKVSLFQKQQIKKIFNCLEKYQKKRRTILAGDLNCTPDSLPFKLIKTKFLNPESRRNFFTRDKYNSYWEMQTIFGAGAEGYNVDYILFGRGSSWESLKTERVLHKKYLLNGKKRHISDHYGVKTIANF